MYISAACRISISLLSKLNKILARIVIQSQLDKLIKSTAARGGPGRTSELDHSHQSTDKQMEARATRHTLHYTAASQSVSCFHCRYVRFLPKMRCYAMHCNSRPPQPQRAPPQNAAAGPDRDGRRARATCRSLLCCWASINCIALATPLSHNPELAHRIHGLSKRSIKGAAS